MKKPRVFSKLYPLPKLSSGAFRRGESLKELLVRAAMNVFDLGQTSVKSTDKSWDLAVASAHDLRWGDCLALELIPPKNHPSHGSFYVTHFSPARARILAHKLLEHAKRLEKDDPGMKCIDEFNPHTVNIIGR